MPPPNPVTPINEWACCIAALSWNLHKCGLPVSQDEIIIRFGPHFPKWLHYKGLASRGEIISLCDMLGVGFRRFLHTNSKDELFDYLGKNIKDYIMGFVLTHRPTNHCMGVESWNAEVVNVMDAGMPQANLRPMHWDALCQDNDADYLFLFR